MAAKLKLPVNRFKEFLKMSRTLYRNNIQLWYGK